MKAIVIALVVLCVVSAALARPVLNDRIIREVNNHGEWVAGHNDRFEGMSLDEVKKMLGTKMDRPMNLPKYPYAVDVEAIPDSFDSRTQWPNCIHPIRDQAQCGSCWAFGATEVLSDRFCIATGGKTSVVLSPQELVSCDTTDYGCGGMSIVLSSVRNSYAFLGGYLDNAWAFMKNHGVPTEQCFPYASQSGTAPACITKCKDGSSMQLYKAKTTYDLSGNVAAIQAEIMKNGPVEVAFDVYEDFFSYKSGVYTHKTGGLAGGHAVKLVGWGVSSGTPYWIVANSWGTSWYDIFCWLLSEVRVAYHVL